MFIAYRFDREVRTHEVHGSSSSPRSMLLLQTPTFEDINKQFHLNSMLINVWNPLIEILNDARPTSMTYVGTSQYEEHQKWFHAYMSDDDDAIEAKLDEMWVELTTMISKFKITIPTRSNSHGHPVYDLAAKRIYVRFL